MTSKIAAGAIALILVASPLAGFAKENGKDKSGKDTVQTSEIVNMKASKNDSKKEAKSAVKIQNKQEVSCLKAYGHLISSGWSKKNGQISISGDCWLPFGIAKKFYGTSTIATSTPDVTAPVISSINASPLKNEATIKWTTNEKSDSVVFYATSSGALDVNSTSTARIAKSNMTKDHSIKLSGLMASTTYYAKIASKDSSGNTSYSDAITFTTKAPDAVVTYPVVSNVATIIGTSTVRIAWKTNEPATSKIYYGTTTVDTNSAATKFVVDSSLVTNHELTISNLSTSTAYEIVIESKNAANNATLSNSFTATTNSGL